MAKIMIVDDAKDFCEVLRHFLSRHGYDVLEVNEGKKALELLSSGERPDLVLCDFRMDDMDGAGVLKSLRAKNIDVPLVIITGHGTIRSAVDLMKLGAEDYLLKPFLPEELLKVVDRSLKKSQSEKSGDYSAKKHGAVSEPSSEASNYVFGDSKHFKEIIRLIDIVAPTDYSVIIYGESGSGKEAIAQEIHKRSKRRNSPFIPIDCGVLTRELANSELFGHEKGSFTGALQQKRGSFEIANKGTIFLDEIANLSYDVQMSLLRVVQERKMRRVGGTSDVELDVRIIVASNDKLWDASGGGSIREDLFHRFNEFVIYVPPLRERKEDIMTFAGYFLKLANKDLNKNVKGFSPEVERIFLDYWWSGNLRELKNVVKRAALLCEGGLIEKEDIPFELTEGNERVVFDEGNFSETSPGQSKGKPVSLKTAGIDAEYELIMNTLRKVNFNKSKAAKLLHIDRKTLYYKINQYKELKGAMPDKDKL